MLKFYSNTKIFVPCPAGVVTGGAELLHQLVDYLRNNGRDAYIVYLGEGTSEIPNDYQCYNIALSKEVINAREHIEVIYEGIYNTIYDHPKTQKILWWLSVDHFFSIARPYLSPFDYMKFHPKSGFKQLIKMCTNFFVGKNEFKNRISIQDLKNLNAINAYQSEYAQWWLLKNDFPNILPLKDYINIEHCKNVQTSEREDIVVYNPKKGMKFTQRLINAAPDIKWVALQGMNREKLIQTIRNAKVYIDFGYHPGKDRLPRECAMNGCCIITGKLGSARFFDDVPLMEKYKFNEKNASIADIISTIHWVIDNYDIAIEDFSYYRGTIAYEKIEFESQIRKLFELR